MSSWLQSFGSIHSSDDNSSGNDPNIKKPDQDEIRRRRLATLANSTTLDASPENVIPRKSIRNDSNSNTNGKETKRERTNIDTLSSYKTPSSEIPMDIVEEVVNTKTHLSEKISTPKKINVDLSNRNLNLAIESIFQFSLRRDCGESIYYLAHSGQSDNLLNSSNISEYLCTYLSSVTVTGGAIGYLGSCYKRLYQKEQTVSVEVIRQDLKKCRSTIISLMVSLLNTPLFEINTDNCIDDLIRLLGSSSDTSMLMLPSELAIEMEKDTSTEEIMNQITSRAFESLSATINSPTTTSMFPLLRPNTSSTARSLLDEIPCAIIALIALCTANKKVAQAVASHSCFLLPPAKATNSPPNEMMAFHRYGGDAVIQAGVAGAALEHHTLLGLLLRLGPDPEDPQVVAQLKDAHRKTKQAVDSILGTLRNRIRQIQNQAFELVMVLLKAGGAAKEKTMIWIEQAIALNIEATKDRPSRFVSSSKTFLLNLNALFLQICKPILQNVNKLQLVNWSYLKSSESEKIIPKNETKLLPTNIVELIGGNDEGTKIDVNFITMTFFMCWRSLHLGFVPEILFFPNILRGLQRFHHELREDRPENQGVLYFTRKLLSETSICDPDFIGDIALFCSLASTSLLHTLNSLNNTNGSTSMTTVTAAIEPMMSASNWIVKPEQMSQPAKHLLAVLPEHFLSDLLEIFLFIAKIDNPKKSFAHCSLEDTLSLIIFFLRRPWAITSPHLRALLGEVLYYVFLPYVPEREEDSRYGYYKPTALTLDGTHSKLLESHQEAQRYLAPSLLLLYGDVEKTGFYDKLSHRRSIMVCLKYLWTLPTHREAFRGIASTSSATSAQTEIENDYFIRFANGIINETNSLVASTMEKLVEIRQGQLLRNTPEWLAMTSEAMTEANERLEGNEREVKYTSLLCFETLHMLVYLTSDEVIRIPFLLPEILPRFTSMLLNVLNKLVGSKSLEIKVENMESYNFSPRNMLREICLAMVHFTDFEQFWSTVAEDGFYEMGEPLKEAIKTVKKLNLMNDGEVNSMITLAEKSKLARDKYDEMEQETADAPEEFLDPIMNTLMRNPVLLPTSNTIVDRATITQHLLNNETDPFNRMPLTRGMLQSHTELKNRIEVWYEQKKQQNKISRT